MEKITLFKGDSYYIDNNKSYILEKGALLTKILFTDDKLLSTKNILKKNDILINYLYVLNANLHIFKETVLKVEALEDTILLEYEFELEKDYMNLISQLLTKVNHNSIQHIYGKKGYILYSLCNLSKDNKIDKNEVTYEYFNVSRSQFYVILSNLKNEEYIYEKDQTYVLNKNKINKFFDQNII